MLNSMLAQHSKESKESQTWLFCFQKGVYTLEENKMYKLSNMS